MSAPPKIPVVSQFFAYHTPKDNHSEQDKDENMCLFAANINRKEGVKKRH